MARIVKDSNVRQEILGLLRSEVTDAEVHIGKNLHGGLVSDFEVFRPKLEELNIRRAIIIPTTTYELQLPNGQTETSCIWEVTAEGNIIYKKVTTESGSAHEEVSPLGPYLNANRYYLNFVKDENSRLDGRMLYVAPIFHPKLDRQEHIEEFLTDDHVVAIKVHGISTHTTPGDMPRWIADMSKHYDKPFIFHMDFLDEFADAPSEDLGRLMRSNRAKFWAEWVVENGVRAYMAHGLRLDPDAARIVNATDNMVVGIGPDRMIEEEQQRLVAKTPNYLKTLFSMINPKRIVFSSDFAWNWKNADNHKDLDWDSKQRVIDATIEVGYSMPTIAGILNDNSVSFFNL